MGFHSSDRWPDPDAYSSLPSIAFLPYWTFTRSQIPQSNPSPKPLPHLLPRPPHSNLKIQLPQKIEAKHPPKNPLRSTESDGHDPRLRTERGHVQSSKNNLAPRIFVSIAPDSPACDVGLGPRQLEHHAGAWLFGSGWWVSRLVSSSRLVRCRTWRTRRRKTSTKVSCPEPWELWTRPVVRCDLPGNLYSATFKNRF